jgi:hypothetical protein
MSDLNMHVLINADVNIYIYIYIYIHSTVCPFFICRNSLIIRPNFVLRVGEFVRCIRTRAIQLGTLRNWVRIQATV